MGFIKRGEFEALKQQVAELTSVGLVKSEKIKEQGNSRKVSKKAKFQAGKKPKKNSEEKSKGRSVKKSTTQKNVKTDKAKKVK
jgi:hypothetical protein